MTHPLDAIHTSETALFFKKRSIPLKFISLRATLCTEPVLGQVIVETTKDVCARETHSFPCSLLQTGG